MKATSVNNGRENEPPQEGRINRRSAGEGAIPGPDTAPWVLFICTGNFYRSRFAEAVFNHHASTRQQPWRAFSRGLAIHLVEGALSPFTRAGLESRGIDLTHTANDRASLSIADLQRARVRVALDGREHAPLLADQFPAWMDRIEYWDVADVGLTSPEDALEAIEAKVLDLLERLRCGGEQGEPPPLTGYA